MGEIKSIATKPDTSDWARGMKYVYFEKNGTISSSNFTNDELKNLYDSIFIQMNTEINSNNANLKILFEKQKDFITMQFTFQQRFEIGTQKYYFNVEYDDVCNGSVKSYESVIFDEESNALNKGEIIDGKMKMTQLYDNLVCVI
jgi:hypothetical protein